MSLSASSRMSRVRSLTVSRVIELFCSRCLNREGLLVSSQKSCSVFPSAKLPPIWTLEFEVKETFFFFFFAYLATFLLDSLLPALDREIKTGRWSGRVKGQRKEKTMSCGCSLTSLSSHTLQDDNTKTMENYSRHITHLRQTKQQTLRGSVTKGRRALGPCCLYVYC